MNHARAHVSDQSSTTMPGDRRDPRHPDWLRALGAATDAASRLATVCFDLERVLGGTPSDAMYRDTLGDLERRVRQLVPVLGQSPSPLDAFIEALPQARETRNDLLHALRVKNGLYRRVATPYRVREFFTVESLVSAHDEMDQARKLGNRALYFDGGAAVEAWYAKVGHE